MSKNNRKKKNNKYQNSTPKKPVKKKNDLEITKEIKIDEIKQIAQNSKLSKSSLEEKIHKLNTQPADVFYVSKTKRRLKNWAFYLFFIIFISLISISAYKLLNWKTDNIKISKIEEELNDMVIYEYNTEAGILINPPENELPDIKEEPVISDYWYYASLPFYDVDFKNLIEKNPDTVAWIKMNNTNINYPIVQTTDNDFYLNHAYDKAFNSAGWVYMDYRNTFNPISDNIVIYGHGRVDNTVFGSLKKTLKSSWQENKENLVVNISTPKENYLYQIFSIYTIESEAYYITTNFYSIADKQKWIDTMKSRNTAQSINVDVTTEDKILTLSTCYNDEGIRIVVQAKLIKTTA
ncbi:MAG: class B sortase [Bacilli bacterium]|nr:class B sortase [Bacilli bacterium]